MDTNTIRRIYDLRAQIKAYETEVKELIASLGIEGEQKDAVGPYIVQVTETKRFDPATAKNNLSAAKFKAICESVPTTRKAKEVLGSIDYAKTQKVSGFTVKIDLPKEV